MYVDIDSKRRVHLMDMDAHEVEHLISMIRGAGLTDRRVFNKVLRELTDKLTS